MAGRGRARLAVSPGLSVWVLEAPDGFDDPDVHAHHAIQLTICLEGRLALIDGDRVFSGALLGVAPDAPHRLEAAGVLGLVFVEPESALGRGLIGWFAEHHVVRVDDRQLAERLTRLREATDAAFDSNAMLKIAREALASASAPLPGRLPDSRIERVIEYAMTHPGTSLVDAAEGVGVFMSESRLRHLFVEQTGLAFKTYMVWQRLVRAVGIYAEGRSLTEAAHEAGFADSAHFSRTFKATFGAPATTLERL